MIRKKVPRELWDYGLRWVSETMSLTHTTSGTRNIGEGCIPLTQVTGETPDISEYLDFGFYDRVWFKDNGGTSPPEPVRWLGILERVGRAMCYWILNQNGQVVSRSTVQNVTTLELTTVDIKETFQEFDQRIRDRGYAGDKPDPADWKDLIDEDVS